jgi:hypothetical protein
MRHLSNSRFLGTALFVVLLSVPAFGQKATDVNVVNTPAQSNSIKNVTDEHRNLGRSAVLKTTVNQTEHRCQPHWARTPNGILGLISSDAGHGRAKTKMAD